MKTTTLIGNLGKDAKIMESDGKRFITFTLAENETYKSVTTTTWYDVAAPVSVAENMVPYLTKGKLVMVIGRDRAFLDKTKNDEPVIRHKMSAWTIQFTGFGSGSSQSSGSTVTTKSTAAPADTKAADADIEVKVKKAEPVKSSAPAKDDDLPF